MIVSICHNITSKNNINQLYFTSTVSSIPPIGITGATNGCAVAKFILHFPAPSLSIPQLVKTGAIDVLAVATSNLNLQTPSN